MSTKVKNAPSEIKRALKRARKNRDAEAVVFYEALTTNANLAACCTWETFRGSWAAAGWRQENAGRIRQVSDDFKRFLPFGR
jgi:hypothetical protein